MFKKIQNIHFVGIGGIGMSGIAEVLLNLGYQVSGSDLRTNTVTDRLVRLGGKIQEGHRAENVHQAQVVVISSAVSTDNVEVSEAHRLQIPVIPRAEMLAELMRMKYGIAVAGSHGKTSTTSMAALVLERSGLDPTIVIGGRLNVLGSNAKLGHGEFLVAEADESDRSFLKLNPTIAVVTNIDREHLDTYRDLADIQSTFVDFANKVPFYGAAILCLDDRNVQALLPRITRRVVSYGTSVQADLTASRLQLSAGGSTFQVRLHGKPLGEARLNVPGKHSVLNALAVIGVGLELDLPLGKITAALSEFQGAERRFQLKGEIDGIRVYDDYGHHPTEIETILETAALQEDRRLVVVFQPHRYSRTQLLLEEFPQAFNQAELLILTDIYAAGEKSIPGIDGVLLAETIKQHGHRRVRFVSNLDMALEVLDQEAELGDLVLTLGAGDVYKVGERFLKRRMERQTDGDRNDSSEAGKA
jgi:UDP-N-acetylmuramate--alanine ligase